MYWVTGILGIALLVAPFLFGYTAETVAAWTSYIIGLTVTLVSMIEGVRSDVDNWEYWAAEVLGVIAIAAPFVFGFSGHITATWTSVIVGLMIAFMAGTRLYIGRKG